MTQVIATQVWRYVGGVLKCQGRTDQAVGPFTVTPPTGGGTDPFILGATQPDATNTGVQDGITLTNQSGDITVTTAGTVIQNLRITGRIKVQAANVTIRNCEIIGNGFTSNSGLIDCNHAAAQNVLIEYCHLHQDVSTGNLWHDGVIGHDYTARRCHIWNVVDGFGVYNSQAGHTSDPANVVIEGNYVHDLCYFSPDPNHSDKRTHNDGVQIQGNSNIVIRGNNLSINASTTLGNPTQSATGFVSDTYYPAVTGQCVTGSPTQSRIFAVTIDQNWMDYGSRGVVFIPGTFGGGDLGSCTGNRFGSHLGKTPKTAVQVDLSAGQSFSQFFDNTWTADGSAVTLATGIG